MEPVAFMVPLIESEALNTIPIKNGVNVLGRAHLSSGSSSPHHVSRRHLEIIVASDSSIHLRAIGQNPCVLRTKSNLPLFLKKGDAHTFSDGAIIEFLPGILSFQFHLLPTQVNNLIYDSKGNSTASLPSQPSLTCQGSGFGSEFGLKFHEPNNSLSNLPEISHFDDSNDVKYCDSLKKRKCEEISHKRQDSSFAQTFSNSALEIIELSEDEDNVNDEKEKKQKVENRKSKKGREEEESEEEKEEEEEEGEEEEEEEEGKCEDDEEREDEEEDEEAVDEEERRRRRRRNGGEKECFYSKYATFHLLKSKSLQPQYQNVSSLSIHDLFQGDFIWAFLSNYMFDLSWLTSECPQLLHAPRVVIFYDERGIEKEEIIEYGSKNFVFHCPPLPHPFGTHHTKSVVLGFAHKIRLVILTANFIRSDFEEKTQAAWVQEFPLKPQVRENVPQRVPDKLKEKAQQGVWEKVRKSDESPSLHQRIPSSFGSQGVLGLDDKVREEWEGERVWDRSGNGLDEDEDSMRMRIRMRMVRDRFGVGSDTFGSSPFEEDLMQYLDCLGWKGCEVGFSKREGEERKRKDGNEDGEGKENKGSFFLNFSFLRRFDYSSSSVRLVGSVPGYHRNSNLKKFGHMKLRDILETFQTFDPIFVNSPLVYQFSSLGSLDEKWIKEFGESTSAGKCHEDKLLGGPENVSLVWPTAKQVRESSEGYAAGASLCSPSKNMRKSFLAPLFATWDAQVSARCHIMPHMKSYLRFRDQNLAWVLLTSANLSKAAWGVLQKNNSQLFIRSYELGVIFLPRTVKNHLKALYKYGPSQSKVKVKTKVKAGHDFSQNSETADGKAGSKRQKNRTKACYSPNLNLPDVEPEERVESEATESVVFENAEVNLVTKITNQNVLFDSAKKESSVYFPIPYSLPPLPYHSNDRPWIWDENYFEKDVHGNAWAPHGR